MLQPTHEAQCGHAQENRARYSRAAPALLPPYSDTCLCRFTPLGPSRGLACTACNGTNCLCSPPLCSVSGALSLPQSPLSFLFLCFFPFLSFPPPPLCLCCVSSTLRPPQSLLSSLLFLPAVPCLLTLFHSRYLQSALSCPLSQPPFCSFFPFLPSRWRHGRTRRPPQCPLPLNVPPPRSQSPLPPASARSVPFLPTRWRHGRTPRPSCALLTGARLGRPHQHHGEG